jgi:hypothetical protein
MLIHAPLLHPAQLFMRARIIFDGANMSATSRWFLLAILLTAVVVVPSILVVRAQSPQSETKAPASVAPAHPVLVELFTSEGCSSCPPADALIEKMDAQPLAGLQLIVMSEHVTYWDHDGWKDPNSSSQLTDRQSAYEDALGFRTPYTPQIIIDGTSVLQMGDASQADGIFRKAAEVAMIPVRLENVSLDSGNTAVLHARIATDANSGKHNADVYVALALNRVESQVLHGENGGRHLIHVAVVQQLVKVGKLEKGKSFNQQIDLKLKPGEDAKNLRIIAFVQEPGPGKVLGVTSQKLAS